jgi:hypothetical protein
VSKKKERTIFVDDTLFNMIKIINEYKIQIIDIEQKFSGFRKLRASQLKFQFINSSKSQQCQNFTSYSSYCIIAKKFEPPREKFKGNS